MVMKAEKEPVIQRVDAHTIAVLTGAIVRVDRGEWICHLGRKPPRYTLYTQVSLDQRRLGMKHTNPCLAKGNICAL